MGIPCLGDLSTLIALWVWQARKHGVIQLKGCLVVRKSEVTPP